MSNIVYNPNYLRNLITFIIFIIAVVFLFYFIVRIAIRDGIYRAIKRLKDEKIL